MKKTFLVLAGLLLLVVGLALPAGAGDVASYGVTMNGANEVPGPGDPDGTGDATIALATVSLDVCVTELTLADIDEPTAMHIHPGGPGVAGGIIVDLSGALSELPFCTTVTEELMGELLTNPGCYYLNVHTAQYPAGAVRGQLTDEVCTPTPPPDSSDTTGTTASTAADTATRPSFTG